MKAVILAAGSQERFPEGHTPKQLLRLANGESIIASQIRMLTEAGVDVAVWTHNEVIQRHVWGLPYQVEVICPTENERFCTAASLYNAYIRTGAELYTLGDVIFTPAAIDAMLPGVIDHWFFISYDQQEIFAVRLAPEDPLIPMLTLKEVWQAYLRGDCEGKLWHWYRRHVGLPLIPNRHTIKGAATILKDCTDIDYPHEWENYLKTGRKNG